MYGRYGSDPLNLFLFIASIVVEVLGNILRIHLIYYIGLAMFIFALYRTFSRNIEQRRRENEAFMRGVNSFRNREFFRRQRAEEKRAQQARDAYAEEQARRAKENRRAEKTGGTVYCYYYCPMCKQQVRIPQGKGRVRITCPSCGHEFETYS